MAIMGIVRLAPGRVGYYDELTRIHLTIASPEATIFEGMNTANLKRVVKLGTLKLVSGSLDPETRVPAKPAENEVPFQEVKLQNEKTEEQKTASEVKDSGEMQNQEDQKDREVMTDGQKETEQPGETAGNDDTETDAEAALPDAEAHEEVPAGDANDADVHGEPKQVEVKPEPVKKTPAKKNSKK